jgi:zinc/manganese transport system substrate-binding protein
VVAAESPWGAVAQAVGGQYVHVTSLLSNPNSDPHEYTASASSAAAVSQAAVVVDNGLNYDTFMQQLLSTGSTGQRTVVNAADVLNVHGAEANPHLWYAVERVPEIAHALAQAFAAHDPLHRSQYLAQAAAFDAALAPLTSAIQSIKNQKAGAPVGETERVAGYLLQEAGLKVVTPLGFALSIEGGSSPNAADTVAMSAAIENKSIEALVNNIQTMSPTTQGLQQEAEAKRIPVVAVSEIVEPVGASYISWQHHQIAALETALGVGS